jgi:hypothetical protein
MSSNTFVKNVHGHLIHNSPKLKTTEHQQENRKTNCGLFTKWNVTQN